jgi:hypothetical protein
VNVLRDTHRALVPDGLLLDFHPTWPPWPSVVARGKRLGRLQEPNFPEELRATEGGMNETVRLGLFRRVAARIHEIREYYDNANELMEGWDDGVWVSPALERRLRATTGAVQVVEKLVFHLYRKI